MEGGERVETRRQKLEVKDVCDEEKQRAAASEGALNASQQPFHAAGRVFCSARIVVHSSSGP